MAQVVTDDAKVVAVHAEAAEAQLSEAAGKLAEQAEAAADKVGQRLHDSKAGGKLLELGRGRLLVIPDPEPLFRVWRSDLLGISL